MLGSSIVLTAGVAVSGGLALVFHLLAARGLGPVGYGVLMASLAYAVLWAIVMEGGISVALTREAAADPERLAWTPRLALWKIALGLAGTAGAVGSGWLLGADRPTLTVIGILTLGMVAVSEMRLAFAVFRVVGSFAWEAALSTLQKAVLLLLAAVVLLGGAGATAVALVFTLSYAVAAVLALGAARIHLRRRLGPAPWGGRPHAGFVLGTCAPLLAIELFTSLYFKLDQILLLQLRGAEEAGLYAAAYRVIETLLVAVSGAMTVLFPRLVVAAQGEAGDFIADFLESWKALWLAALALVVHGSLWGTSLLPLLLGAAYTPSKTQLQILLFALPFFYVNYLLTQSLIARGRVVFYASGAATCAGVNVGLNLFLIPAWGASGAAYATIATEGTLLAICLVGLSDLLRVAPVRLTCVTGAVAAAAVALGWLVWPDWIAARAVLALVVSGGLWHMSSPWPLRRRTPAPRRPW
ncbi:MAG: polysaccharide biosynthesis C-terminal domain-containing protein [Candidatus Rokubacteria bacterium]|nr:polysaccharide biosynthesis C-terminal domain-containing protein [Candidatus Rokubacteria bacterium]